MQLIEQPLPSPGSQPGPWIRRIWNDPDLFDYQDRYLQENTSRGITDYRLSWSRFPIEMWELYRGSFRGQQALPN